MDNQFLRHLQSLTPEGKAAEKKLFIPADQFKAKEPEKIDMEEVEELDEATRSKYLKLKYGTKGPYGNKVSDGTIDLARKKLDANILRRGGASPEAIKRGVAKPFGNDHEVDMAKYRFHNKKAKHLQAAINAYNKRAKVNEEELDEAILKGESARRSILLRKNKEAKQQASRFQDTMKWAGDAQTAALYTKPPEPSPTAKLRTRKTDKRGIEKSGSGDFSAAEKAAKHGKEDADFIMKVLHRKPDGTRVKIFGKGPRGKDKAVHVHKKTELGKPRFFHSASGKEVELTSGGVGMKVLDAKTKKVILDRGNDALWESTINEAAPDIGQNLKGMPKRSGRKLAYALKGWRNQNVSTDKFRVADNRQTRKMGSHAKRWGKKLDAALSDFSKRTGIPLKEGSLGMRKGIRMTSAVMNKGHTDIGKRADAGLLRAISKINKEAGGTGRITKDPHQYQFSDAEQAVIRGHYRKSIAGKNKRRKMNEGVKKAYKSSKKLAKNILKKLYKSLKSPQDAADIMLTGRNF
jgi:hypothetical protein